jgi:uncharacterized protein (UPF0332 family)
MKEIVDLLSKSRRFLRTAELSLNDEDYDSCASRCYYAMFFSAEALLLTENIRTSSHRGLITLFGEHFVKTEIFSEEFGRALRTAFGMRQKGDYATEILVTKEEAENVLKMAKKFVEEAEKYLKEKDYLD